MNSALMLHMQHFVKHHVLDHICGDRWSWHGAAPEMRERDLRRIEQAADEDGVVGNVESAKHMPRLFDGPRNIRFCHGAAEVLAVEAIEHLV